MDIDDENLLVRCTYLWERKVKYWEGFLGLGILLYWLRDWSSQVCVDNPKDRICKIASGMMDMIIIILLIMLLAIMQILFLFEY